MESAEVLRAPLAWRAGAWHQVTLNYSAKGTELYLDGALAAVGPGVALVPLSPSPGRTGFALGSAALGDYSALGEFDELSTFAAPRSARDIGTHYNALKDRAALGPIPPEEEAVRLALLSAWSRDLAEQPGTLLLDMGSCTNLTLGIAWQTNDTVLLEFCGKPEGFVYDLFATSDLGARHDGADIEWEWRAVLARQSTACPTRPTRPCRMPMAARAQPPGLQWAFSIPVAPAAPMKGEFGMAGHGGLS